MQVRFDRKAVVDALVIVLLFLSTTYSTSTAISNTVRGYVAGYMISTMERETQSAKAYQVSKREMKTTIYTTKK